VAVGHIRGEDPRQVRNCLLRVVLLACLLLFAPPAHAEPPCRGQIGIASWYGAESGNRTASGAYFDGSSMTVASPTINPRIGAHVRVTDLATGRQIVALVNDVGPAKRLHRILDLSRAAAQRLGMKGLAKVCVERVYP
jgi:rare lipoprotein A